MLPTTAPARTGRHGWAAVQHERHRWLPSASAWLQAVGLDTTQFATKVHTKPPSRNTSRRNKHPLAAAARIGGSAATTPAPTIASCSSPDLAGCQTLPPHLLHPRTCHGPEPRHKLASGRPPIRKGRCGGKPRTATTHSQCGWSIGFLRNGPGTSRHAVDTNIGKACCQAVQALAQAPPARRSRAPNSSGHTDGSANDCRTPFQQVGVSMVPSSEQL